MRANSQNTQFEYDGDGNLVKKTKPDGTCTIYPSASLPLRGLRRAGVGGVYEVEKAACGGAVTHTRVYYPAAGAMRVDDTLYFVLKDQLGSSLAITGMDGTLISEQRYMPFGQERAGIGPITETDVGFTGQRDVGMGLMDYKARFYDPYLGRFIQADSIVPNPANPQMLNRYSYVGNSPLNYSDPSGNTRIDVINALIRAYGKHAWREGGVGKAWNRDGSLPKTKKAAEIDTTGTITANDILKLGGSSITLSGFNSFGSTSYVTTPTTNTPSMICLVCLTSGTDATTDPVVAVLRNVGTGLDLVAWGIDLYDAGVVTFGGIFGAGVATPFALGGPEVPAVTGLAGMGLAELAIQPTLQLANNIALVSTLLTAEADIISGATNLKQGVVGTNTLNSLTTTVYGYEIPEAYISLIGQSVAVSNDLGWTSFPFPTWSK